MVVKPQVDGKKEYVQAPPFWKFAICRLIDKDNTFYWSSHIIYRHGENWYLRTSGEDGQFQYGMIRFEWETGKLYISREYDKEFRPNTKIEEIMFFIS